MMTKINLRLRLASFFFIFGISIGFGQKNFTDCYIILNQVDKLLGQKDTLSAMRLYESVNEENCNIPKGRFGLFSKIYFKIGQDLPQGNYKLKILSLVFLLHY